MREESEIEIRPIFEAEEFGKEFTPELRAQEDRLRGSLTPLRFDPMLLFRAQRDRAFSSSTSRS